MIKNFANSPCRNCQHFFDNDPINLRKGQTKDLIYKPLKGSKMYIYTSGGGIWEGEQNYPGYTKG